MKISIALCTYNGARYLSDQLNSFLTQTVLPDELVVCDDGSIDDTIDLLENFKANAPFDVRIYKNLRNLGHEQNFGKAIGLCNGDLIFLSDQDDVWLPEKIAIVVERFRSTADAIVIINDLEVTNDALVSLDRTVLGELRSSGTLGVNNRGFVIGCGSAFRSKLRPLLLPLPALSYGHDLWLHEVAQAVGTRLVVDRCLQLYRRHDSNASNYLFASSARPTWLEMRNSATDEDIRFAYKKRCNALSIILERLRILTPEAYADLGASRPFSSAVRELEAARSALMRRMLILDASWVSKKILATRMYMAGDYKYFLGWKSFAKDFLR
jgi:glycosyltransferase involved in cell wall biosynthesis